MIEIKDRIRINTNGEFISFTPRSEVISGRFAGEIWERTSLAHFLWGGKPITGEGRYLIAKEIYDKSYIGELPIEVLEYYKSNG